MRTVTDYVHKYNSCIIRIYNMNTRAIIIFINRVSISPSAYNFIIEIYISSPDSLYIFS